MNYLIIGCGGIGFRWAEGFLRHLKSDHDTLYLVDPAPSSSVLQLCKSSLVECKLFSDTQQLPFVEFKIAVVATTALHRYQVVRQLRIFSSYIRVLILEKNICQSTAQLNALELMLGEFEIVRVNCPLRHYPFSGYLVNVEFDKMIVCGGNWGLACNLIHYMDLYEWLLSQIGDRISHITVDDGSKVVRAKRQNFMEVLGSVTVFSELGRVLMCKSEEGEDSQVIEWTSGIDSYEVSKGFLKINVDGRRQAFYTPDVYQSDLSAAWVLGSDLPSELSYPSGESAIRLQHLILKAFQPIFHPNSNDMEALLPIT